MIKNILADRNLRISSMGLGLFALINIIYIFASWYQIVNSLPDAVAGLALARASMIFFYINLVLAILMTAGYGLRLFYLHDPKSMNAVFFTLYIAALVLSILALIKIGNLRGEYGTNLISFLEMDDVAFLPYLFIMTYAIELTLGLFAWSAGRK